MSETLVLKVEGMTCGGCEQSVSKALNLLDGVEEVSASHADGRVEVKGAVERKNVEAAIEAAGFEVVPS